ncbi:hypothetical protein CKM354_000171500 [Cercospora kikuchii]|uniref:Uncharacterized protein n=1 Tax=Cercospora kikuchii TaxID=84275 RepID=A0A9P3FD84_9PEZI|nr:uncharacterized protein CKM354_000171500 [Cercospora kikuchii]GIZ38295.1 hypothetical protein CKM354_000171500 [Cercospora kikuchii]
MDPNYNNNSGASGMNNNNYNNNNNMGYNQNSGMGGGNNNMNPNYNSGMSGGNNSGQPKEDYLDKAVDAVEKKLGAMTGHNVDPKKYRAQNEKFTDKLRGLFESKSGKKLPSKFSN